MFSRTTVSTIVSSTIGLFTVGLLFGLAACGDGTISDKKAKEYAGEWASSASETLEGQVPVASARDRFESLASKRGEKDANQVERQEPPYDAFVRDVYQQIGWKLRLVDSEGLTDRGEAIWKILKNVDAHALDVDKFDLEAIETRLEALEKLDRQVDSVAAFEPNDAERKAARRWLTRQKSAKFELAPENFEQVAEAVIASKHGDRLERRMKELERVYSERADTIAEIEQLVARNTARYAREMKHFRLRHVFIHPREDDYWSDPITRGDRPEKALGRRRAGQVWRRAPEIADQMKNPVEILHRRIRKTLKATLTEEDPAAVLKGLEPDQPQYAKLKEEYERYREIVAAGGWKEVDVERHLDPGDESETVAALAKRLQKEGYYPADAEIDQTYGEALEKAVEEYQQTHQMRVTGEPHSVFWSSINKSAEWRMKQLGLNLKRWRESNVRHSDPAYVMVNIAGFTVELWEKQKQKLHFGIVVGNDKSQFDKEKDKEIKPNHTPELSAYIDRVIYNPFWNVTDRIRNHEILPKVRRSLENKYKAKLRDLREKVRRDEKLAEKDESGGSPGKKAGQFFVSAGSDQGSDSGEDVGSGPMAGPGEDGSESSESPEEGESKDDEESAESDQEEPSIPIDDLFETADVEDDAKKVQKKAVFDVAAIRELIRKSRESETSEKGPTGSTTPTAMTTQVSNTSVGSKTASATETQQGDEGESADQKSPLEKMFPYLDPKTGVVDPSSTMPDNVPTWYAENDYEVIFPGEKWEYVRMTQGDHNALGRVKVIFPNKHSVYLHDTPKKHLFSRNVRAFSHGCMRMSKPLKLAEEVLKMDGKFDDVNVEKLLKGEKIDVPKKSASKDDDDRRGPKENKKKCDKAGKNGKCLRYVYKPIFLDKQIPVHVEYFTVRVDDEGRANFLADIYDKDAEALGETRRQ